MRRVEISDAATLKQAASIMKSPDARNHVNNMAAVWAVNERKGKPVKHTAYMELSKKATLWYGLGSGEVKCGDLNVVGARALAKRLEEGYGCEV